MIPESLAVCPPPPSAPSFENAERCASAKMLSKLTSQVGTAALLNVPNSLEKILKEMKAQGYDLGEGSENLDGEALVAALKVRLF